MVFNYSYGLSSILVHLQFYTQGIGTVNFLLIMDMIAMDILHSIVSIQMLEVHKGTNMFSI